MSARADWYYLSFLNPEKRLLQAEAEKENIEADLSSMFPKVGELSFIFHLAAFWIWTERGTDAAALFQLDSTVCRELSVSDTEVSEVTWTDNGTFNLSEGHTPQTENSEGEFVCPFSFVTLSCSLIVHLHLFTSTATCFCSYTKVFAYKGLHNQLTWLNGDTWYLLMLRD